MTRLLIRTATLAVATLAAAPAAALAQPSVTLTVPHSADAGKPISVTYKSAHLPHGTQLLLQRAMGTAQRYRTVLRLSKASGSVSAPALPLGQYKYRLAALNPAGRTVASQRRRVKVYGDVPFTQLFSKTGGVHTTPTGTFAWVIHEYNSTPFTAFTVSTECRSVHVDFVPGGDDQFPSSFPAGSAGIATIVQDSRDPVSTTAPAETVGRLDTRLTPGGNWALNLNVIGSRLFDWYINGSASCYSAHLSYG